LKDYHWLERIRQPAFRQRWEVVDGTLHCIGSGAGEAGGSGGDIIYDKKLSNFELSLEWKISEGGNSGIFHTCSGDT